MNGVTGDRIKQAREICGMDTAQLAARVGCTERQLIRYETDLDAPPVATMERIAIATGFPPAFFRQPPGPSFPMGSLLLHNLHTAETRYTIAAPKDILILQSDKDAQPSVLTLAVHPSDYQRIAEMIKAGMVLKETPQMVDGEIVDVEPHTCEMRDTDLAPISGD